MLKYYIKNLTSKYLGQKERGPKGVWFFALAIVPAVVEECLTKIHCEVQQSIAVNLIVLCCDSVPCALSLVTAKKDVRVWFGYEVSKQFSNFKFKI